MRQVASGFAIGSLSISLLLIPFCMVLVNDAPDYTTALMRVLESSTVQAPLRAVAAQVADCGNLLWDAVVSPDSGRQAPHNS